MKLTSLVVVDTFSILVSNAAERVVLNETRPAIRAETDFNCLNYIYVDPDPFEDNAFSKYFYFFHEGN